MNEIRISITINKKELESLKVLTGIKNNKELFNNSLALLAWAVKEKSKGSIVGSISEDKNNPSYKEIIMPCLENVSRKDFL